MTDTQTLQEQDNPITFADLQLNKPILKALSKAGYENPTPIQAGAIPHALAGSDLLLSAQTGSGKTAAFVLPVLDKLSRAQKFDKKIHTLILTPTRELAQQVQDSVRRYGGNLRGLYSIALVGGSPYSGQIRALKKGVQVVIATPGRLIDHMREGRVDLSELKVLILDEADRMLDMGFADDINEILDSTPQNRQTVMSSATWDGQVGQIAQTFTKNPQKVSIKIESAHIEESVYFCDDFHHKNKILMQVLTNPDMKQAVIFTATKMSTERLAGELVEAGYKARYLHGDLPQGKRNRIVADMKSGKCDILIATDVAARGIDISAISHVINYDLPRQVEDYVHRIGRCGRAGRTGTAINLCSIEDRRQLSHIGRYLKRQMPEAVIEGLEPKYQPKVDKDRRKGKTHRQREFDKFARTEGQSGFGRQARKPRRFDELDFEKYAAKSHDKSGFDNLAHHERAERFGRSRADRQPKKWQRNQETVHDGVDTRNARYFDDTARRSARNLNQDAKKERRTNKDFAKKSYRDDYESQAFDVEAAFAKKQTFAQPKSGKFGDKARFDKTNRDAVGQSARKNTQAPKHSKERIKPIEEVFFAKRAAKRAKKFGND